MSYAKALKKLEALPPGERQLAAGQYVWTVKKGKSHCGCAIGKLLTEKQRVKLFRHQSDEGESNKSGVEALAAFLGIDLNGFDVPLGVADLTYTEANSLQVANDGFATGWNGSPEYAARNSIKNRKARYKHVVGWLKGKITNPNDYAPVPAEF